jgi:hypothetical protein
MHLLIPGVTLAPTAAHRVPSPLRWEMGSSRPLPLDPSANLATNLALAAGNLRTSSA